MTLWKSTKADERREYKKYAEKITPTPEQSEELLAELSMEERKHLDNVIEDCAVLFQRSTSCVEGRNGHLSLLHHGHHFLPPRKLKSLTSVHNYLKKREDGTSAAERNFIFCFLSIF